MKRIYEGSSIEDIKRQKLDVETFLRVETFLYANILSHLLTFLYVRDRVALWRTCKHMYNSIPRQKVFEIKDTVIRMLNARGYDGSTLVKLLKETGFCLSGSFILQCILGEEWKSDIDLYYFTSSSESEGVQVRESLIIGELRMRSHLLNFINVKMSHGDVEKAYIMFGVPTTSSYFIPVISDIFLDTPINLIGIPREVTLNKGTYIIPNISAYIDSFDLDINKNFFDGENLYIRNINSLVYKRCYCKHREILFLPSGSRKWIAVRFDRPSETILPLFCDTRINEVMRREIIESYDKKLNDRIEKYEKRGFCIKLLE